MKKMILVLSPLCLGLVSGIALVVACNSSSKSAAQSTTQPLSVVDSAGNVLGTLLGSSPGISSSYNGGSGSAVAVERYPFDQMHTFLDGNGYIWNVGGDGVFYQPISPVFFTDPVSAGCSGTAYVGDGDPKVITKHAGKFYARTGAATVVTPQSYYPAGSPTGTCLSYPPTPISPITSVATTVLALPVTALTEVTAATPVPPVTVN